MISIRKLTLILALVLSLGVAGCGGEDSQQQNENESGGSSVAMTDEETSGEMTEKEPATGGTMEETTSGMFETTGETTGMAEGTTGMAGGEVSVGGFAVDGFNAPAVEVPEVSASTGDIEAYRNEIEPIISGSIRDVSDVVEPKARMQDGKLELGVDVAPIEKARDSARQGLDELQQVEPPESLAPVQETLVQSYEDAIPAYESLIEAFQSGDVDSLNAAVTESLPQIEQAAAVQRDILQDLEQATN